MAARVNSLTVGLANDASDMLSGSSEAPSTINDMGVDNSDEHDFYDDDLAMHIDHRERSYESDVAIDDDSEPGDCLLVSPYSQRASPVPPEYEELFSDEDLSLTSGSSPFEELPTEIVQAIGTYANTDLDLSHLALTSPTFAEKLSIDADIWRNRFLARYDYPFVKNVHEFAFAYQSRRFVLRKLDSRAFAKAQWDRAEHQLLVINDLVLETYNKHRPCLPSPKTSKNLAAMSSPRTSPWILDFMSCALYGIEQNSTKHGQPNTLFDTLQVTLSHLVLSPRSSIFVHIQSSRDNYDLVRVYNYNKPFSMILEKRQNAREQPCKPFRSPKYPGLISPPPEPPRPRYEISMNVLLHVRNFWQRHFAPADLQNISENTYAAMAQKLVQRGKTPQKWDRPLQEQAPVSTMWYGHYSCLHPWPKDRQDLEERQSCAEDWDSIDPMTLNFEVSTGNEEGAYWPPLFSSIPAFADIMPHETFHREYSFKYIRGIAPFIELKDIGKHKFAQSESGAEEDIDLPKWHPFLASRIHGFVHDVPDETILGRKPGRGRFAEPDDHRKEMAIPGWKHIVMVIYKPSIRFLVSVLEHAEEDYGGASGTQMTSNIADIWTGGGATNDADTLAQEQVQPTQADNADAITSDSTSGNPSDIHNTTEPTEDQIQAQLKTHLKRRLHSFTKTYTALLESQDEPYVVPPPFAPAYARLKPKTKDLPSLFSPRHIRMLEEEFSEAQFMTWEDGTIEYAYAYEGVITPGGKIMLGRWWRIHGVEGMGRGKEVGPDGVGIELRPVQSSFDSDYSAGDDESYDKSTKKSKRKRRSKHTATKKRKRRAMVSDSEDCNLDEDGDYQDDGEESGRMYEAQSGKEIEYECVTMVNGEESRAVNANKGLERGPFVFWSG